MRFSSRLGSTVLAAWVAVGAVVCPRVARAEGRHADADFVEAPLLKVAEAHALSAEEAREDRPIRVRGVVTFVSEQGTTMFIQDDSDGIYIDATERPRRQDDVGKFVELHGYTAPGLFAPQIRLHGLKFFGPSPMPPARKSSYQDLATGEADCQLVELEGDVHWIGPERRPNGQMRLLMRLASGGTVFPVRLEIGEPFNPDGLLDARVRVRGVVGGIFNARRQMIGIVIYVPHGRDVVVERPPHLANPFDARLTPINALLQYSKVSRLHERVRVRGTVTLHHPGSELFIWDGSGGLAVTTHQTEPALTVGDDVEVIGFPVLGDWSPSLGDASYRRVGTSRLPSPVATTAARESSGRNHDAQLVTLEAELVDVTNSAENRILVLSDGDRVFNAELARRRDADARAAAVERDDELPQRGSVLRLTGISVVRLGTIVRRPTSFKLVLRTPADIVVIQDAPWWTLTRLFWSMTVLAAIFALVIVWVLILRRRVNTQTEIIRQQLMNEAALEEQYRDLFENANDIIYSHDLEGRMVTINRAGQLVTGFSRAELLSRSFFDLLVPERREDARERLQRVAAGMEVAGTFESEIVAKDGRLVALEISVRLLARDSKLVGFDGIARDVTARKRAEAQLAAANQTLLGASRRAGMAEVASSVLHNVGNVLNTVNVSASMVAEGVKRSKIQNIAKVASLFREHASDLPSFLTKDPQGRQLPTYLTGLAEHVEKEQSTLRNEIDTLIHSIEHIKTIVAMQQNHARTGGGLEETLPAANLIEEALRMLPQTAPPPQVELVRDYAENPEVTVDKHRVLQILVNLLANAHYACGERLSQQPAGDATGRVVIRLQTDAAPASAATFFRVTVDDNGTGIAPENLTRIFEHGFTTKKDGHGFGLHSAAVAAQTLGGTLTVESRGRGQGATFHLSLPLRPELAEKRTTRERLPRVSAG